MKVAILFEVGDSSAEHRFAQQLHTDISKLLAEHTDEYLTLLEQWRKIPRCEFSFFIESKDEVVQVGGISFER